MARADVIVVGLGAVGAAAAYQLAKRGVSVLGLDRFHPPHAFGSSHGETRITRQGVGEGEVYGPLAIRSHESWRELEAATGQSLLLACGLLLLSAESGGAAHHGKTDFVRRSAATAAKFGVPHELLSADEVGRRYPQLCLAGDETAYFEPGGGLVYPERCVEAQLAEARRLGADLRSAVRVVAVDPTPTTARVVTDAGVHEGGMAVLAAGAWTPGLAGARLARLVLQPQALHWFATDQPREYAPERFPAFIWLHGDGDEDLFYGFPIAPAAPTQAVKVATEAFGAIADPDALDRAVPEATADRMFNDHVKGRLRGVRGRAVRSVACVYTRTPDADFVVDRHPDSDHILIASACSGHGFKHSAAVGELIARMVTDRVQPPDAFRLSRLAAT